MKHFAQSDQESRASLVAHSALFACKPDTWL